MTKHSSQKKRILWVAHEGNISGANIALLEYVDALKLDYDFIIVLPHSGNMENELINRKIIYKIIKQYNWAANFKAWEINKWFKILIRSLVSIKKTISLIKKENFDWIFTNTLLPFIPAVSAKLSRTSHIWWIHEYGAEDFGLKIGFGNQKLGFKNISNWSKLIICNSKAVANHFKFIMPLANIKYLYQPVSWRSAQLHQALKKGKYLMFGQITPSKGHIEVLTALARLKSKNQFPSLHIVGPNEDRSYLQEILHFIEVNKLQEQVKVEVGFFIKEDIIPLYDALIVASKAEAFGRVIVEANKAGLRVIIKNSGGAPELINITNGLLYNNFDELVSIFSGEIKMPDGEIILNYTESEQISELKSWIDII